MNHSSDNHSMGKLGLLLCILVLIPVLSPGCLDNGEDDDDRIIVVVSILPQKQFVERVGGEKVKVTVMVTEGQSPHSYEPLPSQLKDIAKADMYFKVGSGVEFETVWMDTILEQNENMEVVDGSRDIELIPFRTGFSVEEEADLLFEEGPYEALDAGEDDSDAPTLEDGGICHIINLTEDSNNYTGVVRFNPEHNEEFVIFLEHEQDHLNFSVMDGDSKEVHPEENEGNGTQGDGHYQWFASYHLENDNYTLNFGPTDVNKTKIVILEGEISGNDRDNDGSDPHIWNSPKNAKIMVQNLLAGLKKVDPDNADYYTDNANAYVGELDAIDQELGNGLEPYRGRKFLVYHPSFGYLAHDYHLEQIAIEEEGKEPTPAGVKAVIDQAKAENIKTVFVHPQFDRSNAETIADEIDGNIVFINPLGEDYLSNMQDVKLKLIDGFKITQS